MTPISKTYRCLRNFVQYSSTIAAPLAYFLRMNYFSSERARNMAIAWDVQEHVAFPTLKRSLTRAHFPFMERPLHASY